MIPAGLTNRKIRLCLVLALISAVDGCSAFQPPDTAGPRSAGPTYPIVVPADTARLEEELVQLRRLAQPTNVADGGEARLGPHTSTIRTLPPNANLFLPKVGAAPMMSEEETRESLRRFIQDWQSLIGADPNQLSLVERADVADGTKLARYEQHPFRYPLRGPYGSLRIRFGSDRHVVEFSSTCIPNAERLQPQLNQVTSQLSWADASSHASNMSVSLGSETYQLSAANKPEPRELVIYAKEPPSPDASLELHLAWEIAVANAPFKFVYLDAVNGEFIATA